jgi:hypothetical protein
MNNFRSIDMSSNVAELQPKTAIAVKPTAFSLAPQTFEQALTLSDYLAESDMVPKDFKGKPGNCLVAIQWGMEIGLQPLQAMQNIAVINGRPSLWGDAVIALARSSPACEYIIESQTATEATCRVKRRGEAEQVRTFSMLDAKAAGLAGKQGPWTQYPKRMMQMRARAFAIRDVFPDVLKGLPVAEEVMDTPRDMGKAEEVKPEIPQALINESHAAAKLGVAAYEKFWKNTGRENRKLLAGEHEYLKAEAVDADKARTVDQATGEIKPGVTAGKSFEEVMDMLCAAKNIDQLFVAGDWIGTVDDFDLQTTLNGKFEEMKVKLEGGAA